MLNKEELVFDVFTERKKEDISHTHRKIAFSRKKYQFMWQKNDFFVAKKSLFFSTESDFSMSAGLWGKIKTSIIIYLLKLQLWINRTKIK